MENSEFEQGDQDYGSALGWDPNARKREDMLAEARKKDPRAFAETPNILFVERASDIVNNSRRMTVSQELFGPFWREGEIAVMYGMPGAGKSMLGIQIAEHLARGTKMPPFRPDRRYKRVPRRVLFIDFEATHQQFIERYSVSDGKALSHFYSFSKDLFRSYAVWDHSVADGFSNFADMVIENISALVLELGLDAVIIDNITHLARGSTAHPQRAFDLMGRLQQLRDESWISILLIAHTPKHDGTRPLSDIDLQGSIDLAKIADSMFAVGKSRVGNDHCYLKHVKSRSGFYSEMPDQVAVFRIGKMDLASSMLSGKPSEKPVLNFLGLQFIGFQAEIDHVSYKFTRLKTPDTAETPEVGILGQVRRLSDAGHSLSQIATRLNISKTSAYRYRKRSGYVKR